MKKILYKNKSIGIAVIFGILFILSGFVLAQEKSGFDVEKEIAGNARKMVETNTIEFKVMKNQIELYTIKRQLDYDIPFPDLKVFNNGRSVLINSFDGTLTFFEKDGIESLKTKIFKGISIKYERTIHAAVDENRLVITLSQPGMKRSMVQYYSADGSLIKDWEVEKGFINGLQYFKQKGLLALSGYEWQNETLIKSLLFFNDSGVLISEIAHNFTNGSFTTDGSLFFGYTSNNYVLYDLSEKKINFTFQSEKVDIIIAAEYLDQKITIVTAKKPILEKGNWYYQDPTFKRFTTNGQIIKAWQEETPLFSYFAFTKSRNELLFKMGKNVISIN